MVRPALRGRPFSWRLGLPRGRRALRVKTRRQEARGGLRMCGRRRSRPARHRHSELINRPVTQPSATVRGSSDPKLHTSRLYEKGSAGVPPKGAGTRLSAGNEVCVRLNNESRVGGGERFVCDGPTCLRSGTFEMLRQTAHPRGT